MLHFEHLIQINDPRQPHIAALSRDELWAALVLRARHPEQFNPSISCRLEELSATCFTRYLQVGDTEHREEVVLLPQEEIRTRIGAGDPESDGGDGTGLRAQSLTRIEEPEPGYLFVRFEYTRDSANVPGGMDVDGYLKSAYVANDREAVTLIRELISSGWPHGV